MAVLEYALFFIVLTLSVSTSAQTTAVNSTSAVVPPETPPPTHAPFPSVTAVPLPSNFSDIPKDSVECWDSHISYSVTSAFLRDQIQSATVYSASTFPTPTVSTGTYVFPRISCTTNYPGLTTLCDGYPRASDCIPDCVTTSLSTSTHEYTMTWTHTWLYPTWSTELDELVAPTCTVAPDLSPECGRLAEAYTWRISQASGNSTTTQDEFWTRPPCSVLVTSAGQPTPVKPKCSLKAESFDAYYWPDTNSSDPNAFCSPNNTAPTGTPTIAGAPSTVVISGVTMTSPQVYHILHNVTVYTLQGRASSIGSGSDGKAVYQVSKSFSLLAHSQPSSSILSYSQECHKPSPRGATRCTVSYHPDFLIQDLATVNAKNYYGGELGTKTTAIICQASYTPAIALVLSDVAAQNGVAEQCEWTWERSGRTSVAGPYVVSFSQFGPEKYHAITATAHGGLGTGSLQPGSATRPVSAVMTHS